MSKCHVVGNLMHWLNLYSQSRIKRSMFNTVHSLYKAIFENRVISELYYKGTILQRNYWKMTISFPIYNSFVEIHGKKIWESQHDRDISKSML